MIFSSAPYFIFLILSLGLYWSLPRNSQRKIALVGASLFFYGWWDYRLLTLLLGTCLANFGLGEAISLTSNRRRAYWLCVLGVGLNLAVLGTFKYFAFFTNSFRDFLALFGAGPSQPTIQWVIPLGISFFTFQGISYLVDSYQNKIKSTPSLLDFLLFKTFFPQLVAGPIVRCNELVPQFQTLKKWSDLEIRKGLMLILIGYFKKHIFADTIGFAFDRVYQQPDLWSGQSAFLATLAYPLQLFFDFSGYTDIALGSALLFGYKLPPNFRSPFAAHSLTELWRRWHLTLSHWFRDYVYIALGGNIGPTWKRDRNLILTMLLAGFWHGASWNFVMWGGLHGLWMAAERRFAAQNRIRIPAFLSWIGTFLIFALFLILFRSPTFSTATQLLHQQLYWAIGQEVAHPLFWLTCVGVFLIHQASDGRSWETLLNRCETLSARAFSFGYGLGISAALTLSQAASRPFIYFQF